MVGTDRDLCALAAGGREHLPVSPGETVIGRTGNRHAAAAGKVAPEQIGVAVAGSGEIIHREPFFVLAATPGRAVDGRAESNALIGRTIDIELARDVKVQSPEQDGAGGIVTGQNRIARIAVPRRGGKRAAVRPGSCPNSRKC